MAFFPDAVSWRRFPFIRPEDGEMNLRSATVVIMSALACPSALAMSASLSATAMHRVAKTRP